MDPTRVLIAYSLSGGGHASVAAALREALVSRHGPEVDVGLIDILADGATFPITRLPAWYSVMVGPGAGIWSALWALTNGRRRTQAIHTALWPLFRTASRRILGHREFDALVAVHPLGTNPFVRALSGTRPPIVTVVTDLVSTHALWFSPGADAYLVPTEEAQRRAASHGVPPGKIHVLGLPVSRRFGEPPADRSALRAQLGWTSGLPVVLLLGGGEGMGPVANVARAISDSGLPCELAVVAGRNQGLHRELAGTAWNGPTHVYGFTDQMAEFMHASDIVVTKAGPSTICEALAAGLPLVLFARLSGQESGNVPYVTGQGAGVWAPSPAEVVAALRRFIPATPERESERRTMADNARRLARPNAATDAAELIWRCARTWRRARTGASPVFAAE